MFNLMIIPVTLIDDTWDYFPDPLLSTGKKTIRNESKRIKLTKKQKNLFEFNLEIREKGVSSFQVDTNLWRNIDSYSEWKLSKALQFNLGLCKFTSDGFNYEANVEEINYMQFRLWVALNESWNVSAEQIGFNFYDISSPKTWGDTKD